MFSTFGTIFQPVAPRQAEHADTRQALQRHDPDQQRRRKSKAPDFQEQDEHALVIMAVEALHDFLVQFIKSAPAPRPDRRADYSAHNFNIQTELSLGAQKNQNTDRSGYARKAASAYSHTAQATKPNAVLLETTDNAAGGPEIDLGGADVQTLYRLIEDLKTLRAANIATLGITRAETFLQSLVNAVGAAKALIR